MSLVMLWFSFGPPFAFFSYSILSFLQLPRLLKKSVWFHKRCQAARSNDSIVVMLCLMRLATLFVCYVFVFAHLDTKVYPRCTQRGEITWWKLNISRLRRRSWIHITLDKSSTTRQLSKSKQQYICASCVRRKIVKDEHNYTALPRPTSVRVPSMFVARMWKACRSLDSDKKKSRVAKI